MIEAFFASWPLFRDAYAAGWLAALALSLVGVVVVARDQVFAGAAFAQASTLGVAAALWLVRSTAGVAMLGREHDLQTAFAVAGAAVAAVAVEIGGEHTRESRSAVLGWIFLFAASASVLILSRSPHGLEEIHALVASSILGARSTDVTLFACVLASLIVVLASTRRRLILFLLDRPMAEAVGMRIGRWSMGVALATGLVIGLALRSTGLLYTFGCLVLPPIAARSLCRNIAPMFALAPILAVSTAFIGFVVAHAYDYPPAQMTVVLQAACVLAAWVADRRPPIGT